MWTFQFKSGLGTITIINLGYFNTIQARWNAPSVCLPLVPHEWQFHEHTENQETRNIILLKIDWEMILYVSVHIVLELLRLDAGVGRPCEYVDGKLRKCMRTKALKSADSERSSTYTYCSFEKIKWNGNQRIIFCTDLQIETSSSE